LSVVGVETSHGSKGASAYISDALTRAPRGVVAPIALKDCGLLRGREPEKSPDGTIGYLSSDQTLDNTDQSNGSDAILHDQTSENGALAPGQSYTVTDATFRTTSSTPGGTYTLFVKTDGHNYYTGGTATDNGNLSEPDEINNVQSAPVTLVR
jgi:hypothetical protein